jgi:hypothetical protein
MSNRLRNVHALVRSLSPAEAEVWVVIEAEEITPTTEVRGRLVGPRCADRTTIEVSYPLRPFARHPEGVPSLTRHVIIPEPSLWEPERPFLYRVLVELWQDGQLCDQTAFDCGLRMGGAEATPRAEDD